MKGLGMYVISFFLMFLIVSLPVVHAQVTSVSVRGEDNVEGFLREQDTLKIRAYVDHPSGDVEQVHDLIRVGTQIPFDSCTPTPGGDIQCDYQTEFDWDGEYIFPVQVNILDLAGNVQPGMGKSTTFYVDNTAPEGDFSAQQQGTVVNLSVSVVDTAYPDSEVCVGLDSIVAYAQLGTAQGPDVSKSLSGCSQDVSLLVELPVSSATNAQIMITVSDKFGNSVTDSVAVTVDTQPPSIGTVSLATEFTDSLQYIGSMGEHAFVRFTAEDNNEIIESSVSVNNNLLSVECFIIGNQGSKNKYECISEDFFIDSPQTFALVASITDTGGHTVTKTQSVTVSLDDTSPTVVEVFTDVNVNDKYYVGPDTPAKVLLTGASSGMNKKQISVDGLTVDECFAQGSFWICAFPASSDVSLSSVSGQDDAGNAFSSSVSFSAQYDGSAPSVLSSSMTSTIAGEAVSGYVPLGEMVQGELLVSDKTGVSGSVDVSVLGGSSSTVPLTCESQEGDTYLCVFSANAGNTPKLGDVVVHLEDGVGNTVDYALQIAVVGLTEGGEINPVIVETSIQPEIFDRSVGLLINQIGLVDMNFNFAGGFPVAISFQECTGVNGTSGDIVYFSQQNGIEEIAVIDPAEQQRRLRFTLRADDLATNSIDIECNYRVAYLFQGSLVDDHIETIPISFKLGGTVGGIDENYEKKLEQAIDDANSGIVAKIAKLNQFVELARTICNLWNTIVTLLNSFQSLLNGLSPLVQGLWSNPATVPAGKSSGQAAMTWCDAKEGIQQAAGEGDGVVSTPGEGPGLMGGSLGSIVNKFCNFVTCRFSLMSWALGQSDWGDGVGFGGEFGAESNVITALPNPFADGGEHPQAGALGTPDFDGQDARSNFYDVWNTGVNYTAQTTQDSLVLSTLNLCLPGIIRGLDKYRQIQCRYALCLRDEVPQGVPIAACEAEKAYGQCKYVTGELFNLINIVLPFDYLMNQIKAIFADPASMIGALWGGLCMAACKGWITPNAGSMHGLCSTHKLVSDLARIVSIVTSFIQDGISLKGERNACDEL